MMLLLLCFFFFFQAEDGIRDWSVTGVQTCALPIYAAVLGFTLGITLATGVIFGLAPAFEATRINLSESLKEGGKSAGGVRAQRLRNSLVVLEVALALVLLVGAGLLIRSFARLQGVDPGFN